MHGSSHGSGPSLACRRPGEADPSAAGPRANRVRTWTAGQFPASTSAVRLEIGEHPSGVTLDGLADLLLDAPCTAPHAGLLLG